MILTSCPTGIPPPNNLSIVLQNVTNLLFVALGFSSISCTDTGVNFLICSFLSLYSIREIGSIFSTLSLVSIGKLFNSCNTARASSNFTLKSDENSKVDL